VTEDKNADRSARRAASCRAHAQDATGEEREVLLDAAERYERQAASTEAPKETGMQLSESIRRAAEYYRACRDAAHAFDDKDASTQALEAETAYENAAMAVAEQVLYEIDEAKE